MAECRGFKNKLGTTIVSLIAKVTGAIAGNIATFNSDGELVDSGKALNSLVEKSGTTFAGNIASFSSNGVIVDSARPVSSLFAKIGASFTVGNIAVFDKQPLTNIVGIKDSGKSVDTQVTSGSSNLITSGAVYEKVSDFNIKLVTSSGRIRLLFNESVDSSGPVVYPLRKFVVINYVTGISSETLIEETYLGLFNYEENLSNPSAPITIYIQIGGACVSFSGSFRQRADGGAVFIPAGDTPETYYNNYKVIGSGVQNSYPSNS